jgi:hypothetical protein
VGSVNNREEIPVIFEPSKLKAMSQLAFSVAISQSWSVEVPAIAILVEDAWYFTCAFNAIAPVSMQIVVMINRFITRRFLFTYLF